MVFFTFASPPLLILKHDTPQDARFLRGLFNDCYPVVMIAASVGSPGHMAVGRIAVGLAMGGVAAFVFAVRSWGVPRMDALRERIAGILLNRVQVGVVAWGMAKLAALYEKLSPAGPRSAAAGPAGHGVPWPAVPRAGV